MLLNNWVLQITQLQGSDISLCQGGFILLMSEALKRKGADYSI